MSTFPTCGLRLVHADAATARRALPLRRKMASVCVYLSGCDGPTMQQGQQAAEGRGADGCSSAASVPYQVGEQDVAQELLRLVAKTPRRKQRVKSERGAQKSIFRALCGKPCRFIICIYISLNILS